MDEKLKILKRYFGYSSFRPGQEKTIDALIGGRDTFAVMPTGAGKSIAIRSRRFWGAACRWSSRRWCR